ncbi:MAG: hypothetical protein GX652_17470 [Burkholderiaceae bacterium]|nr:hypothetical protein [Burkholderiaceae bacterium]
MSEHTEHAGSSGDTRSPAARYALAVENSRRVRWDIDRDVIRGRGFDLSRSFMPTGLSLVDELKFLTPADRRLFSQVQGRTYVNVFGMAERFIGAKMLEVTRGHWMGDQTALEALVRFSDEELKHQALFRRLEQMLAAVMPAGYEFTADANTVASAVLARSSWAVLALTLDIELFTQVHYRESIRPDASMSELWKDVFLYHWKEESQHAIVDELEFLREDAAVDDEARDRAVDDFIELVATIDGILRVQASADADWFTRIAASRYSPVQQAAIHHQFLKAYRWQYIVSGSQVPRFGKVLAILLDEAQLQRIAGALAPFAYAAPRHPGEPVPLAA